MDFCPDLNFLCGLMSGGLLFGSELSLWANVWWAFVSPVLTRAATVHLDFIDEWPGLPNRNGRQ